MTSKTGRIEEMPVGATLTGIVTKPKTLVVRFGVLGYGGQTQDFYSDEVVDRNIRFKPARIEVDDKVITLLRGNSFGSGKYGANAEMGIERGTLVEWEL